MDRRKFMTNTSLTAANGNTLRVTPAGKIPMPLHDPITVELSTGRVVEMVVGELSMLYEAGEIPQELTSIAAAALYPPAKEDERARVERQRKHFRVVKWLVGRVLTNPRVVEAPAAPDEISIHHLYHDEIWQIYNFANVPAMALDNFRSQQALHVESLSGQQDVGTQTEPADAAAEALPGVE